MDPRVALAAENNARWCLAVCQAHGCRTSLEDAYWACAYPPRFYSNLVTLRPGLGALVGAVRPGGFKDSFFDIDGGALGYRELFQAEWIWMASQEPFLTVFEWRRVATDDELQCWEAAWAHGDADATDAPRQFPASLLDDEDIAFMAGYDQGVLTSGFALNLTEPVVGVSNVFSALGDKSLTWLDIALAAPSVFPGRPVVGYERGDDLLAAQRAGFQTAGQLRVWVRAAESD